MDLKKFKIISLTCKHFNGVYSLSVIPLLKYTASLLGMLCFCGAVHVKLPIPGMNYGLMMIAFNIFVSTITLTTVLSNAWTISGNFLTRIGLDVSILNGRHETKLYLRKVMKSLRPLRICIAGTYYLEEEAKLTFMEFLVNGNINILLTLK